MPKPFDVSRSLVREIIRASRVTPGAFDWSLQGFGMFRLYITPDIRLHVWSPVHRVPGVSDIHDHPWSFVSYVVAGRIENHRYVEAADGDVYHRLRIKCGPGGGPAGEPERVRLVDIGAEVIEPGQSYRQTWRELHRTIAAPGTVSIIGRQPRPDPDHATVCYQPGSEWVSAEPRPAERGEIALAMTGALAALDAAGIPGSPSQTVGQRAQRLLGAGTRTTGE